MLVMRSERQRSGDVAQLIKFPFDGGLLLSDSRVEICYGCLDVDCLEDVV